MKALVNRIIPFSNVDGPFNRMAIFFQSCNFNCQYCHNPETIKMCVGCGHCVEKCPVKALSLVNGKVEWNKDLCCGCDTCLKVCPHNSSPKTTLMSVEEVMEQIQEVRPYIRGITTSGGECTLQKDFLIPLFTEAKKLGLTCFVDSNGSLDFENEPEFLKVLDKVMLDVKAVNKEWHKTLCQVEPDMVLKNLDYLLKENKLYEVRSIIFPGKDQENEETVRYVAKHIQDGCDYKIIRYRPFGVRDKYCAILGEDETSIEEAYRYVELAKSLGATKAYLV